MTLSHRSGAYFFAAFYKWSRYTQIPISRTCTARSRYINVRYSADLYTLRGFSCARLSRQQSVEDAALPDRAEKDRSGKLEQDGRVVTNTEIRNGVLTKEMAELQEEEEPGGRPGMGDTIQADGNSDIPGKLPPEEILEQQGHKGPHEDGGPPVLQQTVRHIMRHVPSSVAIITAACVDPESNSQVPLGIVVSSLCTVTLDPPTISFNVRHPSQTLDAIRTASGRFRVHFLDSMPQAAAIADTFTKGNHEKAFSKRLETAANISLPTSPSPPQILDSAVVAALECDLSQELTVADHIIVVAKVSSAQAHETMSPTLTYVQGQYVKDDGKVARQQKKLRHNPPTHSFFKIRHNSSTHPFYKLPLFPGEGDRDTFISDIKAYLDQNPHIFNMCLQDGENEIRYNLKIPMGTLGISISQVIAEVGAQKGHQPKMEPWERGLHVRHEIYGRLSPYDIVSIVERVKQLVKSNPAHLSLDQTKLFSLLRVDPRSTGMLASDILNPLREEGLLPPFQSLTPKYGLANRGNTMDLEQMEQIEHQLREYLKTQEYGFAAHLSLQEFLQNATGKMRFIKTHARLVRARLHIDAFPEHFSATNFDISGQVTTEEARVVVRRLFSFLQQGGYKAFKDIVAIPSWEMLRRVRVHPLITGIDPEFLHAKLKYFLHLHPAEKGINDYLNGMQRVWFRDEITWAKLETLVDELVQNAPLRAITWQRKDILAAMGLSYRSGVRDPTSSDLIPLVTGHTLPQLLHSTLEKHYGVGKEHEMKAVVNYLRLYNGQNFTSSGIKTAPEFYTLPLDDGDETSGEFTDPPTVIRKHVTKSDYSQPAKPEKSELEYRHINFAEELLDLAGKSHGYKTYGLDGERKR